MVGHSSNLVGPVPHRPYGSYTTASSHCEGAYKPLVLHGVKIMSLITLK